MSSVKKTTRKSTAKPAEAKPPVETVAPEEEQPPMTSTTPSKSEEPMTMSPESPEKENFMKKTWERIKYDVKRIPMGITEPENKLKLTTSKLLALTGALFAVFEGRQLLLSRTTPFELIAGIISVVLGLALFVLMVIIHFTDLIKKKIPLEWFLIFGVGFVTTLLNILAFSLAGNRYFLYGYGYGPFYGSMLFIKGGVLLMISGFILLLQGLKLPKWPDPIQIISLIGITIGIYEAFVVGFFQGSWTAWLTSAVMWALLLILFLTLGLIPIKLPKPFRFDWWLVLAVGIAMYYLGMQLSGIIIVHAFLLILIAL